MKKKTLITGALSLAVVGLIGATFVSANAAANNRNNLAAKANFGQNMTEDQREAREADREAHRADMAARHEAVQAALDNSDYDAWVAAEGENSPMLEKINADNFPQLLEAHKLMEQAHQIMTDLGIDQPGMGDHRGMHQGFGMGLDK